jgi:hypothetical protein
MILLNACAEELSLNTVVKSVTRVLVVTNVTSQYLLRVIYVIHVKKMKKKIITRINLVGAISADIM